MYQYLMFIIYIVFNYGDAVYCQSPSPVCTAVPISLSSLTSCTGSTCLLTQNAVVAVPLSDGASACLQFISPDGVSPVQTVNITIDHARTTVLGIGSYHTDDPAIDLVGFCGCPGGTTVSCANNRLHPAHDDFIVCKSGIHKDNSCPVTAFYGTPGTYAAKLGLEYNNRFKVIQLSPTSTLDVGIVAQSNDMTWGMEYNGNVVTSTDNPSFNITAVFDTSKFNLVQGFAVFDVQSPTDFWLLDASSVNGLAQYDFTKIGWLKTDQPQPTGGNLASAFSPRIVNCKNNVFSTSVSWINTNAYLGSNYVSLASRLYPGAIINDPEFPDGVGPDTPRLNIDPYHYLTDGFMFIGATGALEFVGVARAPLSTTYSVNSVNQTLAHPSYMVPPGTFNLLYQGLGRIVSLSGITYNFDNTFPSYYYSLFPGVNAVSFQFSSSVSLGVQSPVASNVPSNTVAAVGGTTLNVWRATFYSTTDVSVFYDDYWICITQSFTYPNTTSGTAVNCNNFTFAAFSWPSMEYSTFTYLNGDISQQVLAPYSPGPTSISFPLNNGIIELAVSFTNLSVQFSQSLIRPVIESSSYAGDTITVSAASSTVPGICYISSSPAGSVAAQQISLTMSPVTYKFPTDLSVYYGPVQLIIRCGQFTAATTEFVTINRSVITNYSYALKSVSIPGYSSVSITLPSLAGIEGIFSIPAKAQSTLLWVGVAIAGSVSLGVFGVISYYVIQRIILSRAISKKMSVATGSGTKYTRVARYRLTK